MIEIPLTQGKVAVVDDDMAHLTQWKWFAVRAGNNWYAVRHFRKDDGMYGLMYMHWAVIGQPINKKIQTDHRNGNGLLNLQENLSHVTRRENQSNQKRRRDGKTSSQYVGVYWAKPAKKWMARIQINGKKKFMGYFSEEKEASNAYQNEVSKLGR